MSDWNEFKKQALVEAIAESERFNRAGKKALKSFEKHTSSHGTETWTWTAYDSVLHAAAKRASMDATRALAAFRKGEPR